jgi:non-specific serine/threonine protein kinase
MARGEALSLDQAMAFALDDDLDDPVPEVAATTPPSSATSSTRAILTARQWQICELIAEGLHTRDIAAKLFLSQRTIEGHVHNIMHKLVVDNRAGIVTWTLQQRRTQPGPADRI